MVRRGLPSHDVLEDLLMKSIAVIGGGITGVTTAYALAKRGFSVTLFERHRYAAMETSFANGGQLSASNAEVWTHWSTLAKGIKWMLRNDAPKLQQALEDAGLKAGDGGLQFSLRDQSQSGQNNQNQSNPHAQRLILSEEEAVPAAVANYGRMFGSNGGVDIRI